MSHFFASGGQSIGASASVPPMNLQGWFPLGLTGLISLQTKWLSRISITTVWEHQFLNTQPLWSNSQVHDYWKNHSFDSTNLCRQSDVSVFWYDVWVCHSFSSREQASFNFMAKVTICSDFGAQENKVCTCFHFSHSVCHQVMGPDAIILVFWMLSFKPDFSLSSFHLHQEAL